MLNIASLSPRRVFALIAAVCAALLAFGLYLQHAQGLQPCPMCIVQRYTLVLVLVLCAVAAMCSARLLRVLLCAAALLCSGFGAFVAGQQSWLQWFPPEFASCGRDFYGLIENYPLSRAIPMIFRGSGDCTAVDWKFLGATIANWSFLWFVFLAVVLLWLLRKMQRPSC